MIKRKTVVAVYVAAACVPVMAQQTTDAERDSMRLVELQDVQVVSTRATKKTPVAFSNMDARQLKAVNHGKDLPSLLLMTPSVTMTSDAGNGIGYTTINVRGNDNTRVNVTANGIPVNDAESSGVFWVNMPDLSSSAQSIQVQRGVGTSTNGAGAFGATINIQTENIGQHPFVGIDASGGSYLSHKETLRFGTGLIDGHWGLQGRLSNIGSKGHLDRAATKLNSYFLQGGYFSDNTVVKFVTFNGAEETYHAWNYASRYEQQLFGRTFNSCGAMSYTDAAGKTYYGPDFTYDADGVAKIIANGGHINYYRNQKDFYHQHHYQLLWNQHLPYGLNWNMGLHYTRGDGYYEQYKANTELYKYGIGQGETDLVNQQKMGNDFFGAVASLSYDNRKGLQVVIGGAWNRYIGNHFGYVTWMKEPEMVSVKDFTPFYKYYDNRARKNDGNIYGKLTYELTDGLSAYLDMQYRHTSIVMHGPTDEFDKETFAQTVFNELFMYDFFNPKFGLNYNLAKHHRLYASVAVSHKEPTRNDFEKNIGTHLNAEKLTDWETGYRYETPRFMAGVNLYYMNYSDQFVLTGQLDDIGEPIKANSGKSYRMGMEIEAAWQPVAWFNWSANATLSKSRNKDWTVNNVNPETWEKEGQINLGETPITFSPGALVNNAFTFTYGGFKAQIQNRYVGEQYLTNTGFKSYEYDGKHVSMMLDSYFLTNLDLSYTTTALKSLGVKEAMLGVTLYNVFNKKYDTNGWSYCEVAQDKNGRTYAWSDAMTEVGISPAAPFNFMVNLSLNF